MSYKKRTDRQLEGDMYVLQDAWAWAREYGTERGWRTFVLLTPTPRRGVWSLRVEIHPATDAPRAFPLYSYTIEYPSSVARTLAATVFQALVQISRMVDAGVAQDELPL